LRKGAAPGNFRVEASIFVLTVEVACFWKLFVLNKVLVALLRAFVSPINNAGAKALMLYYINIVHLCVTVGVVFRLQVLLW
jgi:hypothetical protein